MGRWIIVILGLIAMASAGRAQETAQETAPDPSIRVWSTGSGLYAYHQLNADCDTIEHGHGRNAVWGLWRMPLDGVLEAGPEAMDGREAILHFRCADGSACIRSGAYRSTPDRIEAHAVPFETPDRAQRFAAELADLKHACAARR